ncbi:cell wall-binding repeat-containing protein [Microaceticoccus formicicus]|uniref:cell wall-binding repeat-containing protein n=1 Tax=Microaceticoccus formicicus TaxID=3118105 RepID=UPI003CD023D7|nr:cell wall-binding repeat-containing protein [Peptoniphilaceae bacterium AMB_02]
MNRFKKLTALLLVFVMIFAVMPLSMAKADEPVKLTILHTNDVHGNAVGDKADDERGSKIGFARYKTYIDEVKKENQTLVLDAGDLLHGTTLATIDKGKSMVELANELGIDAFVPGNHDFNYGSDRLVELSELADFPFLAVNVFKAYDLLVKGTHIFELEGIKVGVFGLATPETKTKSNPLNTEGIDFKDTIENAKNAVEALKGKVDVIIALSHLGMDEASEPNSKKVAEQVEGIHLIVDGHSHHKLEKGEMVNKTLIVQAHEHLKNIGRVDITKTGDEIKLEASLIPFETAKEFKEDEKVLEILDKIKEENKPILEAVVGKTKTDLVGERAVVRTGESNLGQLLTDAMIKETAADVAITNGGGIRATIKAGEIKRQDVLTAFPFTNYPVLLEATGQNIIDALEYGLDAYPEQAGKFPHVAGMTFEVDLSGEAPKVLNLMIGDKPVDLEAKYKLVTNDFMAIGGDGYEMFKGLKKLSEHGLLSEVLEKYITELTGEDEFEYPLETRIKMLEPKLLERISGQNRYITAIEVSKKAFDKADTVIIANGFKYPDSLAAGPLTAVKKAPILLAAEKSITAETLAEIERLEAKNVIVVGGVSTVGEEVVEALKAKGLEVKRLGGINRYETAVLIAKEVVGNEAIEKAILASGENPADALAISSLATKEKLPILLTSKAALAKPAEDAIKEWKLKEVVIVGGESTIAKEIAEAIQKLEIKTVRLAGGNRFGTAIEIAKAVYPEAKTALLADGYGYADALALAPLLEKHQAPLLLVQKDTIPENILGYVTESEMEDLIIVGGPNSVSDKVSAILYKLVK